MLSSGRPSQPFGKADDMQHAGGGDDHGSERGSGVLDTVALERLRELDPLGANRLVQRVCKAFEVSLLRLVNQLPAPGQRTDLAAVRLVAHSLKSSSASVGAQRLSQLCAEIETMIRIGQTQHLDDRIATMALESKVVLKAIQQLLEPAE